MRLFASTEMAAHLPSWVSHKKEKCVDLFVASPDYVPYLAAGCKDLIALLYWDRGSDL